MVGKEGASDRLFEKVCASVDQEKVWKKDLFPKIGARCQNTDCQD